MKYFLVLRDYATTFIICYAFHSNKNSQGILKLNKWIYIRLLGQFSHMCFQKVDGTSSVTVFQLTNLLYWLFAWLLQNATERHSVKLCTFKIQKWGTTGTHDNNCLSSFFKVLGFILDSHLVWTDPICLNRVRHLLRRLMKSCISSRSRFCFIVNLVWFLAVC